MEGSPYEDKITYRIVRPWGVIWVVSKEIVRHVGAQSATTRDYPLGDYPRVCN